MPSASFFTTLALVVGSWASPTKHAEYRKAHGPSKDWDLRKFTTLVSFGDSYTDDSRLSYISNNNGTLPPVGYANPANYQSASGGRPWPQYVKQYAGVHLYNYAVSGAVCSNNLTPRIFRNGINFPDIEGYELPAFLADSNYTNLDGTPFVIAPEDATVYSIWIGTNDLGNRGFLMDSQVAGTNVPNYTDCVYAQLKRLYDHGGRYFVLQNLAPLDLAPLYATPENGGVEPGTNSYWLNKPENITAVSGRMGEMVVTTNQVYDYRTPFEVKISKDFKDAKFAVMDMHALVCLLLPSLLCLCVPSLTTAQISDMYYNPSQYFNGTSPPNVQGWSNQCNSTGGECVLDASPDSFLWFDALHPSEQADRVFAKEFLGVVEGGSRWATYW